MSLIPNALSYGAGLVAGGMMGPFFGLVSALRQARTFHPVGDLFVGEVQIDPAARKKDHVLAGRLEGEVLIRFSDALSKEGPKSFDVLGCALRFGLGRRAIEGDQDLLLATIRRPWTMPFAPFFTETSDYLANDYFAVSPFSTWEHSCVYFRLHPELFDGSKRELSPLDRESRRDRVIRKAGAGDLLLELEIGDGPWGPFRPLARIVVREALASDPPELAFDPFRTGAGIEPQGFVQALRRGAYAASRFTRRLFVNSRRQKAAEISAAGAFALRSAQPVPYHAVP